MLLDVIKCYLCAWLCVVHVWDAIEVEPTRLLVIGAYSASLGVM